MGSDPRSSVWKILIGLSIVCGLLVFAGGFFHRRALEESVQQAQDASALYVKSKLAHDVQGIDLTEPLSDSRSASLAKQVDPPGDDGVRIFAPNGTPVFTEGVEAFPADEDAIASAKAGTVSRVIDGPDLRVYTPIDGKGGRVEGVAAVVTNYTQMRKDASGPLDAYRLPLVGLGVVLLIVGVVLMVQATKTAAPTSAARVPAAKAPAAPRSGEGRVTGFGAPPVQPAATEAQARSAAAAELQAAVTGASASELSAAAESPEPAAKKRFSFGKRSSDAEAPREKRSLFARRSGPAEPQDETPAASGASASVLQREVAIREALEAQLEQLRTQVKTQQDERLTATRELTAQLEEATRRAEEAEAQLELGGGSGAAAERVSALEQQLAQARSAAAEAMATVEQLQRAAEAAPQPDPAEDQRVAELAAQLIDAQQRASSAEQRAASVESVRDELEVRVAQLGAKATEIEQRAAELEANLQDANAGGDAVRAEIATLTAALQGANARVQELESLSSAPAPSAEHEAEITRLRTELAKQLERAQAAEDRIASLEADVLAAQRGVQTLPRETPTVAGPVREQVPAPAGSDRYDDVWSNPYDPQEAAPPAEPAAEPEPAHPSASPVSAAPSPATDQNGHEAPEAAPAAEPVASTEPEADEEEPAAEDMWSLRARLAEAAARKKHHIE